MIRCKREQCSRELTGSGGLYCSGLCRYLGPETERVSHLLEQLGEVPSTLRLKAEIDQVSLVLTEYFKTYDEIRARAFELGITDQGWHELCGVPRRQGSRGRRGGRGRQ